MAKSKIITIPADESLNVANNGYFVYCRSSSGIFKIECNNNSETLSMMPGDKITLPELIKNIRVTDLSGATNTIELVIGSGGFYV